MGRPAAFALAAIFAALVAADWLAPYSYQAQFRDEPMAGASARHLLGTDALGRDRWSRLLYGGRISLVLAPAAALAAVVLALAFALAASTLGGWWETAALAAADLLLSIPWLFLLLAARAMLPLNAPAAASVATTFGLLCLLGWAGPARVLLAAARRHLASGFALQARAAGCGRWRLASVHMAPNLAPLAWAQFWVTAPAFLLSEANLGLLGLGVSEPMPSWGNLLREMDNFSTVARNPLAAAPLAALVGVVVCCQLVVARSEYPV